MVDLMRAHSKFQSLSVRYLMFILCLGLGPPTAKWTPVRAVTALEARNQAF